MYHFTSQEANLLRQRNLKKKDILHKVTNKSADTGGRTVCCCFIAGIAVQIPLMAACSSVVYAACSVASDLCDQLFAHSEESYHVCVCVCVCV
jgi:hypothetical protein